jgi:hypothetical protein
MEPSDLQMVVVKMTTLTVTIMLLSSWNGHGQTVTFNRYFSNVNKFQQFEQQNNLEL